VKTESEAAKEFIGNILSKGKPIGARTVVAMPAAYIVARIGCTGGTALRALDYLRPKTYPFTSLHHKFVLLTDFFTSVK
jgi:hypothetical protein